MIGVQLPGHLGRATHFRKGNHFPDFTPPFLANFNAIPYFDRFGWFDMFPIQMHLPAFTGIGRYTAGFEGTGGPQPFVNSDRGECCWGHARLYNRSVRYEQALR
jgi:hypothetical protein